MPVKNFSASARSKAAEQRLSQKVMAGTSLRAPLSRNGGSNHLVPKNCSSSSLWRRGHIRPSFSPRAGLSTAPVSVKHSQVADQVQQRPLSSYIVSAPNRPSSKSLVLFDLSKMSLDDLASFCQLLLRLGLGQMLSHRLHRRRMTPDLNDSSAPSVLAPLGYWTVLGPTAIPFYPLAFLLGLSHRLQLPILRAGHCSQKRIVLKIARAIAFFFVRTSLLRLHQHLKLALGSLGHLR